MKTIPTRLEERRAEVAARARAAAIRRATHHAALALCLILGALVVLHVATGAVEKAAHDALDARERPLEW